MKHTIPSLAAALLALLVLAGCSGAPAHAPAGTPIEEDYASYSIPEGWEEAETISGEGRRFFLPAGADPTQPVSNLSVFPFHPLYTSGEPERFLADMARQLNLQLGVSDTEAGSVDSPGLTVLSLTFDLPNVPEGYTASQTLYFILPDHEDGQAVQIGAVDLSDGNDSQAAALGLIKSFSWK